MSENALIVANVIKEPSQLGKPRTYTAEKLQEACAGYLSVYANSGRIPTLTGLAFYLGVDRQTIDEWCNNRNGDFNYAPIIKQVRHFIEFRITDALVNNEASNSGAIFLLKNWYGYTDEHTVNTNVKVDISTTISEIAKVGRVIEIDAE